MHAGHTFNTADVAEITEVTTSTVRRWVKNEDLKAHREEPNGHYQIRGSDLWVYGVSRGWWGPAKGRGRIYDPAMADRIRVLLRQKLDKTNERKGRLYPRGAYDEDGFVSEASRKKQLLGE